MCKSQLVMDSGASAPVAPPSMLPNVKVRPSEGSQLGQQFTSASKHKLIILANNDVRHILRMVSKRRSSSRLQMSPNRWCRCRPYVSAVTEWSLGAVAVWYKTFGREIRCLSTGRKGFISFQCCFRMVIMRIFAGRDLHARR